MKLQFLHLHPQPFEAAGHPRHNLAPVSLGTAMAYASAAGHDVAFTETATGEVDRAALTRTLQRGEFDLLVVQPTFEALPWVREVATLADRPTLLVGPPAVHRADELARDGVLCATGGEDRLAADVADALGDADALAVLPGLHGNPAATPTVDLDSLPLPRHDLLLQPKYRFYYPLKVRQRLRMGYLLGSRGCPYACTFCSEVERASFGKRYRTHSPARIAEEFATLESLGANGVYFTDDLFAQNKDRFLEVADALAAVRRSAAWCAQARAGDVDDDIAQALARAGCSSVACGIESGSDRVLELLRKGTTVDAMRRGVSALRRAGIDVVAYLILGTPGETAAERRATLELAESLDATLIQVHIFASYPGTEAERNHPALGGVGANKFQASPAHPDHDELVALQRRAYRSFYLRPRRLARHVLRRFDRLVADPADELRIGAGVLRHTLGL